MKPPNLQLIQKVREDFDSLEDVWTVTERFVVRHHRKPRVSLFDPTVMPELPVPLRYSDVMRTTETSIPYPENTIYDHRTDIGAKSLSEEWTGRTILYLRLPKPAKGMKWVNGRETKIVSTTRPDSVWPEVWYNMTQKARKKEI